jgi:hypothetical protein
MDLSHFRDLMIGIAVLGVLAMMYSTLGSGFEYTGVSPDEFRAMIRASGHSEVVYRWFHIPEARAKIEMLLVSYLRKHVSNPKLLEHVKALDMKDHKKMAKFGKEHSEKNLTYTWQKKKVRKNHRFSFKSSRSCKDQGLGMEEETSVPFDDISSSLGSVKEGNEDEEISDEVCVFIRSITVYSLLIYSPCLQEKRVTIDESAMIEALASRSAGTKTKDSFENIYKYHDDVYAQWFQTLHRHKLATTLTDAQYQVCYVCTFNEQTPYAADRPSSFLLRWMLPRTQRTRKQSPEKWQ